MKSFVVVTTAFVLLMSGPAVTGAEDRHDVPASPSGASQGAAPAAAPPGIHGTTPTGKMPPTITEDRRWIIKQKTTGQKGPAKVVPPLKWESDDQRTRCELRLKTLETNFVKARYYSTQGDHCSTAESAKAFLEAADVCKKECPEGYLEKNGYGKRITVNLEKLHRLGLDRCFR
jgi:hypothetical protein